jgi:hypothetical protein
MIFFYKSEICNLKSEIITVPSSLQFLLIFSPNLVDLYQIKGKRSQ